MAPALREVVRRLWRERWWVLESAISGQPWLLSSGFSWTDVYLSVLSRWALDEGWRRTNLPKVEAIARAVAEREPIGAIWKRHHASAPDA